MPPATLRPTPPGEPPGSAAADPGLFGPASVTWRVHADPVMGVAGLRALLLQALHPVAMRAVTAHSDFRDDPWGRLRRTAEYVGTVTYGTAEEAERAAARVRAIHRRLGGTDPRTGAPYRVDDPHLLRWVHCCEVDSFLTVYARAGGRLGPGDADRYLTEQRRAARLVGLDPATVPGDTATVRDYFTAVRPELAATGEAWAAARVVLAPPMPGWVGALTPARPTWAGLAALAVATLPGWARRRYRLPGLPLTGIAATGALRALRTTLLAVPAEVREGPHLAAARRRLSGGDGLGRPA